MVFKTPVNLSPSELHILLSELVWWYGNFIYCILLTVCIPVIQTIALGASNTKVMGSIPRERRKKSVFGVLHILNAIYVC